MMRVYLTRPGAQRASDGDACWYEMEADGVLHRCAIGCLLTEQSLSETRYISAEFAQQNCHEQSEQTIPLRDLRGGIAVMLQLGYDPPELRDVDPGFLEQAQVCHDAACNWEDGVFKVEELDELAARYTLTVVDEPEGAPREEAVLVG